MAPSQSVLNARPAAKAGGRLGKEVADFLIELSIGVHRYSMYPEGHPTLEPSADRVLARLARLLEDRPELSLGVAHRQLVIDGVGTDRQHPVLSDLANRLHDNHVGAITFTLDAEAASVEGLLSALAAGSEGGDDPIGLRPQDQIPSWPGVKVFPVGYHDLELDEDGEAVTDGQVLQLWLGLARAAMSRTSEQSEWPEEDGGPAPALVARHLRGPKERAYDEVIVGYLLKISEQLAEGDESLKPLRDRVSELVSELDLPTLERILRIGGDAHRRRQIVRQAFQGLGATAALKILETAASASGQEISLLMARMLTKLSFHADAGAVSLRPKAANLVKESVDALLADWSEEDPNPEGYVRILDELARTTPYQQVTEARVDTITSPRSVIQMAIEVDAYGDMVDEALDEILEKGGLNHVSPLVQEGDGNEAARRIRERIGSPAQIDALAEFDQVSTQSLELLVDLVGPPQAVTPLLRLLAESRARGLRRTVFDQLIQMSEHIGRSISPFLEDPRWYVVRNMLELVAALPERPSGFSVLQYVTHPDARVRRAALPVALADPGSQDKALVLALREDDERMVRMGLLHLREELSRAVVPLVIDRCLKSDELPASLRLLAIRVLAPSRDPAVRDAMLHVATSGRTLFGRPRLATTGGPDGELTKASLEVLVDGWAKDPRVTALLKAVAKARDPELQPIVDRLSGGESPPEDDVSEDEAAAVRLIWKGEA